MERWMEWLTWWGWCLLLGERNNSVGCSDALCLSDLVITGGVRAMDKKNAFRQHYNIIIFTRNPDEENPEGRRTTSSVVRYVLCGANFRSSCRRIVLLVVSYLHSRKDRWWRSTSPSSPDHVTHHHGLSWVSLNLKIRVVNYYIAPKNIDVESRVV